MVSGNEFGKVALSEVSLAPRFRVCPPYPKPEPVAFGAAILPMVAPLIVARNRPIRPGKVLLLLN